MSRYIEQVTRIGILLLLVLALVVVGAVWFVTAVERGPVTRGRLTAFARRHGLFVTAGNGSLVIRYLATTRRWRATGLLAGLIVSIAWALREGGVRIDFLTLFAGWFVGALVAEFRLAASPSGPRRAAWISPRVPGSYLPRGAWALVPIAAGISLVVGAVTLLAVLRGHRVSPLAGALCVIAVAVASLVFVVQRSVLHRPQPAESPDVIAADDAIRSRSLHVLAGGGVSIVLYCVLGQLAEARPAGWSAVAQTLDVVGLLGIFAVPLLGFLVATSRWSVARPGGGR
jgi:hypothetical protein